MGVIVKRYVEVTSPTRMHRNVELNLPQHLNFVAALPCIKMHSAHRARENIDFLCQETPDFIAPDVWHPDSPDLACVRWNGGHFEYGL